MIYVRYEDSCANKVETISSLASSLNLEIDLECIRRRCDRQASTADWRSYRPEGPKAWQRGGLSKEDAKLIEDICGAEMQEWGYPLAVLDGDLRGARVAEHVEGQRSCI